MIEKDGFHMWDAVVAWRDKIYQSEFYKVTKTNYLTAMLKLIESDVINICHKLSKVDEQWAEEAKQKIENHEKWSQTTKTIRKSCLKSFYSFVQNEFDYEETAPYKRHPQSNEIKHMLSSCLDKALTEGINPTALCIEIGKINQRDLLIVYLMLMSGHTLEEILDLKKNKESYEPPYIRFRDYSACYISPYVTDKINEISKNSTVYLFETSAGKRITRTQVTRNLKQAGYNIGLNFPLTPRVLHGFVNGYMSRDKRNELEIAQFF